MSGLVSATAQYLSRIAKLCVGLVDSVSSVDD